MDWDRRSAVLWLPAGAGYPTESEFEHNVGSIKWNHAIEALQDIYKRQAEPAPPITKPWMMWNDGTIFSPGQIQAVRSIFDDEVAERGGAIPRPAFAEI
jgi:hypothetical protein